MALEKAMFYDPDDPSASPVFVQFNPNSLTYSYDKKTYTEGAKKDGQAGSQQSPLAAREQARLSMRLFFNTYDSENSHSDVRDEIKPLRAFLCKTEDKETANGKTVVFAWGTLAYRGTMDSFSVSYQMFAADGTPVQAEASLSITGEDEEIGQSSAGQGGGGQDDRAGQFEGVADCSWLFEE